MRNFSNAFFWHRFFLRLAKVFDDVARALARLGGRYPLATVEAFCRPFFFPSSSSPSSRLVAHRHHHARKQQIKNKKQH